MTHATPPSQDGEPEPSSWRGVTAAQLLTELALPSDRVAMLAVDGRSGNGKSTLADALAAAHGNAAVVHTDDVAWHLPMFEWVEPLVHGVLAPAAEGNGARFRPAGWEAKARPGFIEVPAGIDLLIVEGVGAGRREISGWLDALIWTYAPMSEARERGIARDVADGGNGSDWSEAEAFWDNWMADEVPFFAADRPWDRANAVVAGYPILGISPELVAVSEGS